MALEENDIQRIRQIIQDVVGQSKTDYANIVELSNANSKGDLHVTVKGRSDGSLDELVKEVVKQFKETQS